jgi:hypothetical protein
MSLQEFDFLNFKVFTFNLARMILISGGKKAGQNYPTAHLQYEENVSLSTNLVNTNFWWSSNTQQLNMTGLLQTLF